MIKFKLSKDDKCVFSYFKQVLKSKTNYDVGRNSKQTMQMRGNSK
uniref:Toxin-antitoxin system, toxin component, RelE domain protein n=1 Tax=Heterorhabditis bacteriophora TaxID=37862 RepID=A0A1I7WYK8_HETBA